MSDSNNSNSAMSSEKKALRVLRRARPQLGASQSERTEPFPIIGIGRITDELAAIRSKRGAR